MKLSSLLRKLKLYKPSGRVSLTFQELYSSYSLKFKRFVYFRRKSSSNLKDFEGSGLKILVVMNTGGIGNAVEATPLVQAIRTLWPVSEITIVSIAEGLFADWCVPDHITENQEDLKGKVFDHAFFAYCFYNKTHYWKELCDIGEIHEPKVWFRKYLLKPEREYILDMLKPFGYKGPVPPLYVSIKKPDIEIADCALRICLVPGAKTDHMWRHKRWPYYGELAAQMLDTYPKAQLCVIGTQADPFPADFLGGDRIIDLRGKLSLAETAWFLKSADLAIGNDCGPMHIAYAVQTPSVVLFGPTCEIKNAPCNKAAALSFQVPCRPCQYDELIDTCDDPCCMDKLKPHFVMEKAGQVLLQRDKDRLK